MRSIVAATPSAGVAMVEPAQTDTDMWRAADGALEESVAALTPAHRELYARHIEGSRKMIPRANFEAL